MDNGTDRLRLARHGREANPWEHPTHLYVRMGKPWPSTVGILSHAVESTDSGS
jgi:hypothetical protein